MTIEYLIALFYILILASYCGFELISKIPPTLHTPLMSGSNAISGITITGAWIAFLIATFFGISMASTYTAYSWDWLPLDILGNTVSSAVAGAAIGWIYSKVQ